jgi:hypothetical protein
MCQQIVGIPPVRALVSTAIWYSRWGKAATDRTTTNLRDPGKALDGDIPPLRYDAEVIGNTVSKEEVNNRDAFVAIHGHVRRRPLLSQDKTDEEYHFASDINVAHASHIPRSKEVWMSPKIRWIPMHKRLLPLCVFLLADNVDPGRQEALWPAVQEN